MALKAGRVGVAPDQVDVFGQIKSEATSGYTKQEADAKFETQTHAASTYETKSEAAVALAEKQSTTLSVPIEMLAGSFSSVEDVLNQLALDEKQQNILLTWGNYYDTETVLTLLDSLWKYSSIDIYVGRNNTGGGLTVLNVPINNSIIITDGTYLYIPFYDGAAHYVQLKIIDATHVQVVDTDVTSGSGAGNYGLRSIRGRR